MNGGPVSSRLGTTQRLHRCQLALAAATRSGGKGKARRSGPEAERLSGEGLALLLRLGKRRSIEPKRPVACRRGLPASVQAATDDARRAPNRSSSAATCGKAHAHTGLSSHDQNVLQLPVRPVAG